MKWQIEIQMEGEGYATRRIWVESPNEAGAKKRALYEFNKLLTATVVSK